MTVTLSTASARAQKKRLDNEKEAGRAIRESGVPREEIFVITKLYPDRFSDPEAAIEQALDKLDIGYIDMMLLHHPGTDDVKAYMEMEKYVESGKIRSLGGRGHTKELLGEVPRINRRILTKR